VRQKRGAESFAACGQRRGLLALDLGSIFKKLLHQKTFILLRSAQVTKIDFHNKVQNKVGVMAISSVQRNIF
jgi:hypothetical protein